MKIIFYVTSFFPPEVHDVLFYFVQFVMFLFFFKEKRPHEDEVGGIYSILFSVGSHSGLDWLVD